MQACWLGTEPWKTKKKAEFDFHRFRLPYGGYKTEAEALQYLSQNLKNLQIQIS